MSVVRKIEHAEEAWREALASLPDAVIYTVRIGVDDRVREIDPRDVASVLAVLRARMAQ